MQSEPPPSFYPYLCQRYQSLIWSCLDADLTQTAVFHAERYFAMDRSNHESRHLYATSLFREGQTYSALSLVNGAQDEQCTGCMEIKARCCKALGRHGQAREVLDRILSDAHYVSSASSSSRISRPFPEEAALRCRSGTAALKGNLTEKATTSFREALKLNPFLMEAFEGLCALGQAPEIDEILAPRPAPVKRVPPEDAQSKPTATGAGFFTPDTGGSGNLFRGWKPEIAQPQPFRMAPPPGPRDSIATNDSSFYPAENSFLAGSRPLSSADESGPVTKRLRSTASQPEGLKSKPSKTSLDDPSKKARARPALSFANIFSSAGRRSQQTTSSRTNAALGKSNTLPSVPPAPTRRSSRLQSGTVAKPKLRNERRKIPAHTRTRSIESEKDEESTLGGEVAYSTSPPSAALSPRLPKKSTRMP
ncbi:hypothetical protein NLJ89_g10317 [Agrocybe chaxingu]|uniref:Uncharacterized protein n=1 Tax=Agrocybe chaxingu TaxID=84603 RepID=A0A9W8MP17_9AGAR|nr:hypothetical protein NLJ89_g10317 [Agrocybe chaxingu]